MSFDSSEIKRTCEEIADLVSGDGIVFDNVVQRSFTWDINRRSLFMHSVALRFPIPPVYAKKSNGDNRNLVYDILDGKQRLTTINKYLNDEFALGDLPEIRYTDTSTNEEFVFDASGKKFSELSEELQKRIRGTIVSIIFFDNLVGDEERELFKRLNNGKPLTSKNKALASCKNLDDLIEIGEHPLFNIILTKRGRENKNQVPIIMKMWCMLNQDLDEVSFESRKFNPTLENVDISDEEKDELERVFDYALEVFGRQTNKGTFKKIRNRRRIIRESHIVSLVPFMRRAIDSGVDSEQFGDWIDSFYKGEDGFTSISSVYDEACKGGSARNASIQTRHHELEANYNDFFGA